MRMRGIIQSHRDVVAETGCVTDLSVEAKLKSHDRVQTARCKPRVHIFRPAPRFCDL